MVAVLEQERLNNHGQTVGAKPSNKTCVFFAFYVVVLSHWHTVHARDVLVLSDYHQVAVLCCGTTMSIVSYLAKKKDSYDIYWQLLHIMVTFI